MKTTRNTIGRFLDMQIGFDLQWHSMLNVEWCAIDMETIKDKWNFKKKKVIQEKDKHWC